MRVQACGEYCPGALSSRHVLHCSAQHGLLQACVGAHLPTRPLSTPSPYQTACAGGAQHRPHTCPSSPCPCGQTRQQVSQHPSWRCHGPAVLLLLHTLLPVHGPRQSCRCLEAHAAGCPCMMQAVQKCHKLEHIYVCCEGIRLAWEALNIIVR